ncbi:DUF4389 domain-containing protein [Streptomyces sp. NPDC050145]|uniref:DUF4389 domain-containing protein n=1 Tax=Streptomyces sp. NPDC050145 TaxID=3365602 RepID=UPI0037AC98A4
MSTSPGFGTVPLVPGAEPLPELEVPPPGRQNRLTVLLRLLLLLPHAVVLVVLSVVAVPVVVAAWCGALLIGRAPDRLERWLAGFLGYETRLSASAMLLTDRLPPFALERPFGYPVQVRLHSSALNRFAVLFRLLLVLPAACVCALVTAGWWAVSFVTWLVVLTLGRMPLPLRLGEDAARGVPGARRPGLGGRFGPPGDTRVPGGLTVTPALSSPGAPRWGFSRSSPRP